MTEFTKEEKASNSEEAVLDPRFILTVCMLKELKRIGILSENEMQNITMGFAKGLKGLPEDMKKYDEPLLLFPLAMLADEGFMKEIMDKWKDKRNED